MSGSYPLISIGIPTYNRRELACRAIRSAMAQEYPAVEIVVSDNASEDRTSEAVEAIADPRIKLLKQGENLGMVGNFNACLEAASGEYFLMLSDDDLLEPDALMELSRAYRGCLAGIVAEDVGVSWSPVAITTPRNEARWVTRGASSIEPSIDLVCGLFDGKRGPRFCSILVRTADARAVGGYLQRHRAIADCGNWCRIALQYRYAHCASRPLARYTMHPISVTAHSVFRDWIEGGKNLGQDCARVLEQRGDGDALRKLRRAQHKNISNLVLSILLQRPLATWLPSLWAERHEVWRYVFTPMVMKRAFLEGWKLMLPKRDPTPS